MAHRADGLNDIFEHSILVRENIHTEGGTIKDTPVNNLDIVNKQYVDSAISGSALTFSSPLSKTGSNVSFLFNTNNTWTGTQTFNGSSITLPDDKIFNIGSDSQLYFEASTSELHFEQLNPGVDLILGFNTINFGSGVVLGGHMQVPSGQDGNYNLGSATEKMGTIYSALFSDGATSFATSSVVVKNQVNTFTSANGVAFRATGQKISSPSASTLDITATTTLNLQIGGTTKLALTTSALTFTDGVNIPVGTSSGTKIGTATTQKLGFYNATPIVQQTNTAGNVTAGGTYTATEQAMLTDAYTCLRNLGLLS